MLCPNRGNQQAYEFVCIENLNGAKIPDKSGLAPLLVELALDIRASGHAYKNKKAFHRNSAWKACPYNLCRARSV